MRPFLRIRQRLKLSVTSIGTTTLSNPSEGEHIATAIGLRTPSTGYAVNGVFVIDKRHNRAKIVGKLA